MNPLEFCAMLCDNTERAVRTMRQDVRGALRTVDELSSRRRWSQDMRVGSRLSGAMGRIEMLLDDLEAGSVTLAQSCLELAEERDPATVELLRVELESLRYKATKALRALSEALPRSVDELKLPEVVAASALSAAGSAERCEIVLHGTSLMEAMRDLLVACGRAAAPLREIVRHTTSEAGSDVQVVECLTEVVSHGLGRGMQFVLGTVDNRYSAAPQPENRSTPQLGTVPAPRVSDRLAQRALRWWGVTYEEWLSEERVRVRRVNRFALWNGRGAPADLFLYAVDVALGGPILMVGDTGHHPLLGRLAHPVGVLITRPRTRWPSAHRGDRDTLLVHDCPPQLQDGVRRELERISRGKVRFG
ncbi:hypothetical protein AB0M48_38730 [Lentzea sp. NPDC051208]|uniref:hypothetical protein n=1 Tax=Lentzea sp. NPDC051208 TaxID=3154642 RepID=UPI00343452A1